MSSKLDIFVYLSTFKKCIMIKSSFLSRLFLIAGLFLSADVFCVVNQPGVNIIPYPQQLQLKEGKFVFGKSINVVFDKNDVEIQRLAKQFATQLKLVSGLKVTLNAKAKKASTIRFTKLSNFTPESYQLSVEPNKIQISAGDANGIFYALQSLYQMLPVDIYAKKLSGIKVWEVPCVEISDAPRFSYRGLHLDVSRHFFPLEFIKKYIDAMAIHKLNRFHWHLTDDQGWRIEIKKYPRLTQIGSQRSNTIIGHYYENFPQQYDEKPYGGFYTQEQAREIVAYAAERFITVIPEIEMPGHAMAAISAYPYLSCTRKQIQPATKWGIFEDVFCPRDSTFEFMENVLTEIMDIFPSQYIHIGGDECPKTRWKTCPDCQNRIKTLGLKDEHELQSYFVQRIEKFVNAKGRKIIGWDEILEGGLAPNATVMSWRGTEGGIAAAQTGHDVVMTPGSHCYFDHYQAEPLTEPTAFGGLTTLEKVYSFEPVPEELNADQSKHILGAQANLWTEYIETTSQVEYMAYPRVSAMAEVLWTNAENKNWSRFTQNMSKEFERFDKLNINASKSFFYVYPAVKCLPGNGLEVSLKSDNPYAKIYFTTDGTTPTVKSTLYAVPLILNSSSLVKAQAFENGEKVGAGMLRDFVVSKVTGLPYGNENISSWYRGGNESALTDGVLGNTKTTNEWVGLVGNNDRELIFDLKQTVQLQYVSVGMLSVPGMRALFAPEISVSVSSNGVDYQKVASESIPDSTNGDWKIYRPEFAFPLINARFVKLKFKYAGEFTGINGVDNSFLFLDEIQIK